MKTRSCLINFSIVLGICCFTIEASAQSYYPGGLGNASLLVWLNANKAASIAQNGSNQVSQWSDLSGNSYNFSQTVTGNMPVYGTAASPTGKPALTFISTSSQYLSVANLPASISFAGGVSSFVMASFNPTQTTQGWQRFYDFGVGQGNSNLMMGRYGNSANLYYEGWNGGSGDQTYTTSNPIVNGYDTVYEAIQQGGTAGTLTAVAHYLAGTSQANNGAVGSSRTWLPLSVARTTNYIGRSNWAADNYFSGTLSEILLYNAAFNTTQRTILENYLSTEWRTGISTAKYVPPSTATYGTNLVGIGYTSSTDDFLTDLAGSTDGLGFSSGTGATDFLNTTGYLMAAHNAQSNTILTNATVPGVSNSSGTVGLWNRSWNVQKTGGNSTGLVTLNFNFADYNGTAPNSTYTYDLLYNATDGSFATGPNLLITPASTSTAGNTVSFGVNAAKLANGYYTIIWSTTGVLPLTLTTFTAARQGSTSLLDWSTAIDADNGVFEIERAANNAAFGTIGSVPVQRNGDLPDYYTFTDTHPATGVNTYRLKILNQQGIASYSSVRLVDFQADGAGPVMVYPNPATDLLHITVGNPQNITNVLVIDTRGRVIRTINSAASNTTTIPLNGLAAGIYFIKVSTGNASYTQKILKN
jgi:hypothetical protein